MAKEECVLGMCEVIGAISVVCWWCGRSVMK